LPCKIFTKIEMYIASVCFVFFNSFTHIHTSLTQYSSVADNAGNTILLHVFASSERQECGNQTELKKRTKHEILKHHDVYVSFFLVGLFHRVSL
jgi:hypothetical protein